MSTVTPQRPHSAPTAEEPPTALRQSTTQSLREMNEGKVQGILQFLADAEHSSTALPSHHDCNESVASTLHDASPGDGRYSASGSPSPYQYRRGPPSVAGSTATGMLSHHTYGLSPSDHNVYDGIRAKMDALRKDNEAKDRKIEHLQQTIETLKTKTMQKVRESQQSAALQAEATRLEHERAAQRHMTTVDGLLRDKDALSKRVEALLQQVKAAETEKEVTVRRLEDAHSAALSKMKGRWATEEKQKKDQWMLKESKRIKETTLRSMEPDITLLINRHKAEKRRLEEEHAEVLRRKDEALAAKDIEIQEIRAKISRDTDDLIAREREAFRQRLSEQADRLQSTMEENKRTAAHDKSLMERDFEAQRAASQRENRALEHELTLARQAEQDALRRLKDCLQEEAAKLRLEKDAQVEAAKDQLRAQNEMVLAKEREIAQMELKGQHDEIRRRCRAERDAEISKVIARLEDDHVQLTSEAKEATRNAKESVRSMQREVDRVKSDLAVAQEQLRLALDVSKKKDEELHAAREKVQKLQQQLQAYDETSSKTAHEQLQDLDGRWQRKFNFALQEHDAELERMRATVNNAVRDKRLVEERRAADVEAAEHKHALELETLNQRISLLISKKDGQLREMHETVATLEAALQRREMELQRHEMLLRDQ